MKTIYVKRMGTLTDEQTKMMETLKKFISQYFNVEVKDLPSTKLMLAEKTKTPLTVSIFVELLLSEEMPTDGIMLAVTNYDIKTHTSNWVYGYGAERCAVISLARMTGEVLLIKATAHEICHALGMRHCKDVNCNMHLANDEKEALRSSIELCSDCKNRLKSAMK